MSERIWMNTAKLRHLSRSGYLLQEIREINEEDTGWAPSMGAISKKLKTLGEEPRHKSRKDLLPWKVKMEHSNSRLRHMLEAESRRREGQELSETDRKAVRLLRDILSGHGTPFVVGYHPEIGFYLTDRTDADEDIIRV